MLRFYRENRIAANNKGSFSTWFKKLWVFIAENLIGGFIWLGLSPFNSAAVNLKKCLNADDTATPDDTAA